jgi:predicted acetyltransferase
MGRIVDFELFLQQYRFRAEAEGESLTFHVSDPFLEWNNGTYTVELQGGAGKLTTKPSKHKVKLSIGTLTTLLLGYKRAPDLAALERIEASDETIELLDAAVIRKKPYISDYI